MRIVDGLPVVEAIDAFISFMEPTELNSGEDLLVSQMNAAVGPPKTLEQLQQAPRENMSGYELHHIVEQNDDNIAKRDLELEFRMAKFGREAIDNSANLVWVSRFQHEQITGYYNSKYDKDPQDRLVREVLKEWDFASQRAFGMEALKQFGVLQR